MPTEDRSARGKMEWSKNESVANHFLMSWTESIKWDVKPPCDSPQKREG